MLKSIIKAFAGMQERSGGVPLVYLDSAATTQKPQSVIDAIVNYYKGPQGNVHRSTHQVASAVGAMVGAVRRQVGDFLGGAAYEEVIFTPGTTASLNLVAQAYGHANLAPGDEVLVSAMEHHSNYLPWHILCEKTGAQLRVIPIQEEGILDQKAYGELLSPRTKLVALTYVSNVLGFVNPLQKMIAQAHAYHAVVVVDAAQAVPHLAVDVKKLDCDFLAFSGHKTYGPTGIGVLYGKKEHLDQMLPLHVGGGMVANIAPNKVIYDNLPHRLEAGTLHLAGIAGLGAAISFLQETGQQLRQAYEKDLTQYLLDGLKTIPTLQMMGATSQERLGIVSFTLGCHHPLDVGMQLDLNNIAVRTGSLCATPLMNALGVDGVVRISLGIYNTKPELDKLVHTLKKIDLGRHRNFF